MEAKVQLLDDLLHMAFCLSVFNIIDFLLSLTPEETDSSATSQDMHEWVSTLLPFE